MTEQKTGFTRKVNGDGSKNPKYVDLLDEDKPISGQKFVCVSFISPENILKQKNLRKESLGMILLMVFHLP